MKTIYKEVDRKFIQEFSKMIQFSKSLVITSHLTPDDDAMASVLAVYYYLTNHLKISTSKIKMIFTADKSKRWEYFANYEKILFTKDLVDKLDKVDLIIALDGSSWDRFSRKNLLEKFHGKSICVDHHPNPTDKFDLLLVAPQYSSTTEILYRLFLADKNIDKNLAEILLMGILGDIGDLRFASPKNINVVDIIKTLVLQGGIFIEDLKSKYDVVNPKVFKIYANLTRNYWIEEIKGWPRMVISTLSKAEIIKGSYQEADIDEARNLFKPMLKRIEGVPWGFVIQEKHGFCSISLRSVPGSVNVRKIVQDLGIGGGHDRAAAGNISKNTINESLSFIIKYLKNNKPELS